jgi:hypothetical protein
MSKERPKLSKTQRKSVPKPRPEFIAECTDPTNYTDISHFPSTFASHTDLVSVYAKLGVRMNLQFKFKGTQNYRGKYNFFKLFCSHKDLKSKPVNIKQALDLAKTTNYSDCPFEITFKWDPKRQHFKRCKTMNFQHSHALAINYSKILRTEEVLRQIKIHIEVRCPPSLSLQIINK